MLKILQLLTTPIFAISFLFYMLLGFAWKDGRSAALGYVLKLQAKYYNKEGKDE